MIKNYKKNSCDTPFKQGVYGTRINPNFANALGVHTAHTGTNQLVNPLHTHTAHTLCTHTHSHPFLRTLPFPVFSPPLPLSYHTLSLSPFKPSSSLFSPSHSLFTPSHSLFTPSHSLFTPSPSLVTPSHLLFTHSGRKKTP